MYNSTPKKVPSKLNPKDNSTPKNSSPENSTPKNPSLKKSTPETTQPQKPHPRVEIFGVELSLGLSFLGMSCL